jgi:hypothetical protein
MTRFALIHTLAAQKKAREAERTTEAHVRACLTCKAEKPCADRKWLELHAEMQASKAIAQ